MNQRKQWWMLCVLGLLLLAIGAATGLRVISRHQENLWIEFQDSCAAQVSTFEEYVEYWIVRDQMESIVAASRLLLLGNGLYVDVVLPDETHLREQDKDLDSSLTPGEIDLRAPFAATAAQDVAGRLHEITVPISLSGYAGSVLGIIRVGFSGEYVSTLIRHEQLLAAGIGSGSWVVLMAGLSVLLRVSQRRRSAALGGDTVIRCGSLAIDQRRREVLLEEKAIDLPPKLFALLLLFVRDPGAVLSDDDILHSLWAEASYATTADVKQCVYMLRQRFVGVHADPKRLIANVKGFGYRLDPNALDEDLTQI